MECHLGGLTEQPLDAVRIGDARQLHQDAVAALARDHRLVDAGLVDTAADDLDRLLHGTRRAVGNPAFRQGHLYARPVIAEAEVALGLTDAGAQQIAERRARGFGLGRVVQREGHRAVADGQIGVADIGGPQPGPRRIQGTLKPLADDGVHIDFKQQIGAALKIETQVDSMLRHPGGQGARTDEVRQREQHAKRADRCDHPDLGFREVKHDERSFRPA